MTLSIEQIVEYVTETFPGVVDNRNWGERALFYNPGQKLPKGIYFLTFKEKDGAHDSSSQIQPGQYRLNIGLSKTAFTARFGFIPARPPAGGVVNTGHDFTTCDIITPHPVYGWMSWIAVKNPSPATLDELKPLLAEAYKLAATKFSKRIPDIAPNPDGCAAG
ncbi:MAG: DUF6194 family protein [Pseudomonadales bacterium]|jgi:hypothetical protein|nr:DUF6194 family protein [Pseudomonadales bacterium]